MTIDKIVAAVASVLHWLLRAFVWVLTIEDRYVTKQINDLRKQPGFESAAEEAIRLDRLQGGHRHMHRVMDRYGVPDARWFK